MTFEKKIDEFFLKEVYSFSKDERTFCIFQGENSYDKIAEVRFEKQKKSFFQNDLFYLRIIARKLDGNTEEEMQAFQKVFPALKAFADEELSYSYLFVAHEFGAEEGILVEERFHDVFKYIPSHFKQFQSCETKEIDFFVETIEKTRKFIQKAKKQEPRIDFYKKNTGEFFFYLPNTERVVSFSYETPHVVFYTYEQNHEHQLLIDEQTSIDLLLQKWLDDLFQRDRLKRLFEKEIYHQEKWRVHLRVDADLILDFLKMRHTNEEIEKMLAIERTRREESIDQKLDFEIQLFDKEYFLVSVGKYHFLIKKGFKIVQPAFRTSKEDELVHFFERDGVMQVEEYLQNFLEREAEKRIQEEMKRFTFHLQKRKE